MNAVIEACDYHGPYPGNFIPSLLATGEAVRERLCLDYVPVFPEQVRDRPWVSLVRRRGFHPRFVDSRDLRASARSLCAIASATDARVIRSHFSRLDLPAGMAARIVGARSIWHIHTGVASYTGKQRASDVIKVRVLGRALCDRVLAVSDDIARQARMRGHPDRKVSVVPNGIELTRFAEMPTRDEARTALGLDPDQRVALAFCWAPYLKGADVIAAGCANRDVTVLMVGGEELAPYRARNIHVVKPLDDPRILYAAADVFVSASRHEGFSYAVGEAMAAGLPVASSDIAGPAVYFASPGVETFASEDPEGLARVVADLLDVARSAERGEANRRFVTEHLGLARHVEAAIEVLEREVEAVRHAVRGGGSRPTDRPGAGGNGAPARSIHSTTTARSSASRFSGTSRPG